MKCVLVLALCAFVLAADAYRHGQGSYRGGHHGGHRRGQRRHGYIDSTAVCVEKGGECMDRSECKTDTSLITGSCDAPDGMCCVTREYACEKWHQGICVSEAAGCSSLNGGYRSCGMPCSEGVLCCVPENMGRGKPPGPGRGEY
ncbi:hypothetical protein NP493_1740g00002 [Ridgeia piscesae]|uniref:Uncharacterized protein n=1 Tax=Ridgeia piscesae TaxID=27915 RepID=A0AAD9JU97_RIDPI|nr:hypothetical protein NP493_1740g00002 [Ridgeia piscesae]